MKEYHIFGPPGTGKTTRLSTQSIPAAVKRYGPDRVLVASFTKAAANELTRRLTGINERMVGTLHAFCYRELGRPVIAETKAKEWNHLYPVLKIKGGRSNKDIDVGGVVEAMIDMDQGERFLQQYNLYRNKNLPEEKMPPNIRRFMEKWEAWKSEKGYYDFTDLLTFAKERRPYPPNRANVIIVDEAQDLSPLQLSLIRRWGLQTDYLLLAGDDDQTIYSFTGASPDTFLDADIPDDRKIILNQSFRIPKKVYERAMRQLMNIRHRQEKDYMPTSRDGFVSTIPTDHRAPHRLVVEAIRCVNEGKSVMFLGSCGYILNNVIEQLKARGTPFHNPYRPKQRAWNPLYSDPKSCTGKDTIENFFNHGSDDEFWDICQFVKWVSALREDVLTEKGKIGLKTLKAAIDEHEEGLHTCRGVIKAILIPEAVEPALARDFQWLKMNLKQRYKKSIIYPFKVYQKYGLEGLQQPPRIIVGTIHSVKGGEADIVYLFPDLSRSAFEHKQFTVKGREEISRLFYVAITRAKEELCIMLPQCPNRKPYFHEI